MASAQNLFTDGLAIDNSPLVQPNTTLSSCLNGTILTFNGNEYVLQNEIGNGKIGQNAQNVVKLKDGFIPIGMKEHNGILYIVSIKDTGTLDSNGNPIYQEEIGSFPAPGDESGELTHRDDQAFGRTVDNIQDSTYTALFPGSQLHTGDRIDINILGYTNINNIDFSDLNNTGTNEYQNKLGQLNLRLTKSNGSTQDVTNLISGSNVIVNSPVLTLSDCKNPDSLSVADLGDYYSIQYDTFLDTIDFNIYSTHITIQNDYNVYMSMNPLIKINYNCPDGKFNSNLTINNSVVSNPESYVNSQYNYIENQREINALYMIRYTNKESGEVLDESEYIGDPVYLTDPIKYNYDSATKLFTKEFEYSIYPGATYAHLFGIKKVGTQQVLFRTSSGATSLNSCSINNRSTQNCFYWESTGSDIIIHNQSYGGGGGFNWVFFDLEDSNSYGILKNPQASPDVTLQGYIDYQIQSTGLYPQLNNSHFYIALKVQFGEGVDMPSITNGDYNAYFTDLQYYIPAGNASNTYVYNKDSRDLVDSSPWEDVNIFKSGSTYYIPNSRWFTYTDRRELNPKLGEYNINSPIFGGALVSNEYSPQIAFGHSSGSSVYYDAIKVAVNNTPAITNFSWYNHPEYLFEDNYNSEQPLKVWLNFGNPYVSAWTSSGSATGSGWANYRLESINDYLQLFTSISGETVDENKYHDLFTINAPANPTESQPQINFSYELEGADSLVEITANTESYEEDQFMVASIPLVVSPIKLQIQTNYFTRQIPYVQNLTLSYSNNKFYIRSAADDNHTIIPSTNIEITEISEDIWSEYQSKDYGLLGNFLINKYKDWAANGVFIKFNLENVKSYFTPKENLSDQVFICWAINRILLEYFPSNPKQSEDLMEAQLKLEKFWPNFNYPSPTYEEVTIYDYNLPALEQFITGINAIKLKLKVPEDYIEYKGQPLYGENGLIPTRLQQWNLNEVLIPNYYSKTEQKTLEESINLEYIIKDTLVKTKESEISLTTEKENLESVLLSNTNIDSQCPSFFSKVKVFRVQLEDGSYSYGAVEENNINTWDYKFVQYQKYVNSHKLSMITNSEGYKNSDGSWNTTYNIGFNEISENDISYSEALQESPNGLYYQSIDETAILSFIPEYTRLNNFGELEIT